MKKPAKPADPAVAETKQHLMEMTEAFCDAHLNAEYKRLCRKMIEKLARKRPPPFLRGRLDLWAAGIAYALGSVNFLFDKSFAPYISASDLCAHFGTKQGSTAQKATAIREMFDLGYLGNPEFLTKRMGEHRAVLQENLLQMAPFLLDDMTESEDEGGESTPATRRDGEFVDGDHPAMTRFYNLSERYERSGPTPALQKALEELIERDPDFYDPYLLLYSIKMEMGQTDASALLDIAYQRALERVVDKRGQWPKSLEWGWMENRHIIRTFLNKAIALWTAGETDGARDLFRKLLHANPEDNIGARDYLLAVRLGMTFEQFEKKFASQFGYNAMKMIDWFDANIAKFPDEFDWWKEAVGYDHD